MPLRSTGQLLLQVTMLMLLTSTSFVVLWRVPLVDAQSTQPQQSSDNEDHPCLPQLASAGCWRAPFRCNINVMSYSAYNHNCATPNNGHVVIDGRQVWDAGWCRPQYARNLRRVNTMIVDPFSGCTASDHRRFDTWENVNAADDLVAYLQYIRTGALLIGVTGDEPTRYLAPALRQLRAAGVYVDDVQSRGSFTFVIQVGYPEKTVFAKSLTNAQLNVQLNVVVNGTSTNDLKLKKI